MTDESEILKIVTNESNRILDLIKSVSSPKELDNVATELDRFADATNLETLGRELIDASRRIAKRLK